MNSPRLSLVTNFPSRFLDAAFHSSLTSYSRLFRNKGRSVHATQSHDSLSPLYRPSRRSSQADCRWNTEHARIRTQNELYLKASGGILFEALSRCKPAGCPCHHAGPGKRSGYPRSSRSLAGTSSSRRRHHRCQCKDMDRSWRGKGKSLLSPL